MRRTRGLLDEQHVTRTINAVAAAGLEVVRVEIDWEGKIALTTACAVGKNRGAIVSDSEERKKHSQTNAFEAIGREYLRHEVKRGLPSTRQYRWTLERWIFPELGAVQVQTLKRSDIIRLVDDIGNQSGPAMARQVFSVLRRVLNWYAAREDDFNSLIKPGMAREVVARARDRDRVLDDHELRAVWRATDGNSWPFGCLVRFLFLTAARRSEAQGMRWAEVNGETGDWVLPVSRNKVPHGLVRPLSAPALAVLNGLPRIGEYVFTMAGRFPIGSISKCKRLLDEASGVGGWTMHDVRRTARSLMARAGVPERHAEECLGHIQGGVKGIYDHHKCYNEKKRAYEALATQIELIVNSQSSNVRLNSDARARSGPSCCAASVVREC